MNEDEKFVMRAIEVARSAMQKGNEPFGAVLVKDGVIVAEGENAIYTNACPVCHAEMQLLSSFLKDGVTDLSDYTLYTNAEPCFMCSGAMSWLKLGRLVYGASDIELGMLIGEKGNLTSSLALAQTGTEIRSGVLKEESLKDLTTYFAKHKKG